MKDLEKFNYWNSKVDPLMQHSAQQILAEEKMLSMHEIAADSCGQGQCNCGGGCNGECATGCSG